MTDRPDGGAPLPGSARFRSAVDFPSDVLSLEGLEAIVVADFDSGALSGAQMEALQSFVARGGALVLTGGETAGPKLKSLPEVLVPLRPDGTSSASLTPLVDLANLTTTAVTTLVTGPLRSGRVVVGGPSEPPLIVEAPYGLGLIVQLTYDPFTVVAEAEQAQVGAFLTAPTNPTLGAAAAGEELMKQLKAREGQLVLPKVAWSVPLYRAAAASRHLPDTGERPPGLPAPQWALLDQAPAPTSSSGGPAGVVVFAYPLIMGAAVYFLGRGRGRSSWRLTAVPALAVIVSVTALPVDWGLGASPVKGDEVTIERISTAGVPSRVESFHRLVLASRGDLTLRVGRGTLATTMAAPRPPPALPVIGSQPGRTPGPGGDVITLQADTRVELAHVQGWDVRRLHTVAMSGQGGWLETHLRLQAGRLVGTVTNHGERPVRRMRVQSGDGTRADLAVELPPGASAAVDAPFRAGEGPPKQDLEGGVLEIAASSDPHQLGPGELALVGVVPDRPALPTQNSYRPNTSTRAVATIIELEAADDFVLLRQPGKAPQGELHYGAARTVCCGASQGEGIYELRLPTGMPGPFAIEAAIGEGNTPQPLPSQFAIYDWATRTWRPLLKGTQSPAAIAPTEIENGFVRLRAGNDVPPAGLRAVTAVAAK